LIVAHDAGIAEGAIREHGEDLAEEVNARNLYRPRDGSPVGRNQGHARTKNYSALFEKDGPRVRLRENPS
jgi:hypothetical protein